MLKEQFIGRNPSHFKFNPIVKMFIVSETFLWSAWNFITPIFAIFVVNNIAGGTLQIAAFAFSTYLISRVVAELIICRILTKTTEFKKFIVIVLGMLIMSLSYIGFAFSQTVTPLFIFYTLAGIGLGIVSPAKSALFSMHLDKDKETTEWGIYDAVLLIGMAFATALGGFIATQYGFPFLFILAAVINLLGTIPYLIYIR